jgi:quinolinate synthase
MVSTKHEAHSHVASATTSTSAKKPSQKALLERFPALPTPDLAFTPAIERATAAIYEKVKTRISPLEWATHAPYIHAINTIKKQRNAVILAHNYQTPEIFHGVADVVGDSLYLAKMAAQTHGDIIVQCGVHFMAETSKLLSPDKTVLIPDVRAGCSLAESITGADVRELRKKHPGVPIVAYVNTSADVKAEVDICCTSANAVQVVESLGVPEVICLPDQYLAAYVASLTKVKIITWAGACEVHERFTGEEIRRYRENDPEMLVIAHPECPPDVIAEADFTGSTAQMINWVKEKRPARVAMVTECSMADNVSEAVPDVEFVKPCNLCPHMKRITLPKILDSLLNMREEIIIEPELAARARLSVERMVALKI